MKKRIELVIAAVMISCMLASLGSMLFIVTKNEELMYCTIAFLVSGLCGIIAVAANASKSSSKSS